jgi:hypothetical protein
MDRSAKPAVPNVLWMLPLMLASCTFSPICPHDSIPTLALGPNTPSNFLQTSHKSIEDVDPRSNGFLVVG